jgi:uncharacterized protein YndB with AHSA1/START domain
MVKFSDGPEIEVTVEIGAAPERVWELISDINLPSRFQNEFKRAEWVTDGPALGAEFTGHNERKDFKWDTSSWVVEYEPLKSFGWAVSDPINPGATWTYRLSENADGTRLVFHRRLGPGPSGITAIIARHPEDEEAIIAARDAEQTLNMQGVVDGIKHLAETQD